MREKIKLESSAGTGHFYTTMKNKKLMPEKMEIKKFDPVVRKHVMYKEGKITYDDALRYALLVPTAVPLLSALICFWGAGAVRGDLGRPR